MKVANETTRRPPARNPRFVLDTGAILEAPNLVASECVTTPKNVAEIQPGGASARRLDVLLAAGLETRLPTMAASAQVQAVAKAAGNWSRLSAADADVLALALDVAGATLVTDDHTVLDVARRLQVATQTIRTQGIVATKDWSARCSGCNRAYAAERAASSCDVCGHEVRLKPKR